MVSLHYTGANFTHRPHRGSRFARNNDRSTFTGSGEEKESALPFRVIFLDIDVRRTGEKKRGEKKKGSRKVDPISQLTVLLFSNASNNYRFICPSIYDRSSCLLSFFPSFLSPSLSLCESAKGAFFERKNVGFVKKFTLN